jgi:hypothetical protein
MGLTEFIRPFSHLPLISGHAMVFKCYSKILFINRFNSQSSKLSSVSVLLSQRAQLMSKCSVCTHTEFGRSIAMEIVIIKGILYFS